VQHGVLAGESVENELTSMTKILQKFKLEELIKVASVAGGAASVQINVPLLDQTHYYALYIMARTRSAVERAIFLRAWRVAVQNYLSTNRSPPVHRSPWCGLMLRQTDADVLVFDRWIESRPE